jgi:high-affinity nickel permease
MFGLDEHLAQLGQGQVVALVALSAMLLGLRHATDPDHLTAVLALVAGDDPDRRRARRLGLSWGLGHATSLLAFGVPIVLYRAYLPEELQTAAETAVGVMIVVLALRLLRRARAAHLHQGAGRARSGRQAYGIGLVHGMGGSAGVGVLLLASIPGHAEAVAVLAVFAVFTALSMALASTTVGVAMSREAVLRRYLTVVPALAVLSLAFGVWYALGALDAVPYIL